MTLTTPDIKRHLTVEFDHMQATYRQVLDALTNDAPREKRTQLKRQLELRAENVRSLAEALKEGTCEA